MNGNEIAESDENYADETNSEDESEDEVSNLLMSIHVLYVATIDEFYVKLRCKQRRSVE